MSANAPLNVDYADLQQIVNRASDTTYTLDQMTEKIGNIFDSLKAGVGEFSAEINQPATQFLLAWRTALDTMSDGTKLIASNVTKTQVDLQVVDTASTAYSIT